MALINKVLLCTSLQEAKKHQPSTVPDHDVSMNIQMYALKTRKYLEKQGITSSIFWISSTNTTNVSRIFERAPAMRTAYFVFASLNTTIAAIKEV